MALQPSLDGRKTILVSREVNNIVRAKPAPELSNAAMAAGRHLVPTVPIEIVTAHTLQIPRTTVATTTTTTRLPSFNSLQQQPMTPCPVTSLRLLNPSSL
jgi:hypothetical protein